MDQRSRSPTTLRVARPTLPCDLPPSSALASCACGLVAIRPMTSTPTSRRGCAGPRTIGSRTDLSRLTLLRMNGFDGGGINVVPRGDHAMMYVERIRMATCDSDYVDSGEDLSGGKDDRVFRLNRVDER